MSFSMVQIDYSCLNHH